MAMTRNKAVDQVLGFRKIHGRIPMQEDYEKHKDGLCLEAIIEALGIDLKPSEKLGVPPYAAVNIEVLHEDRRRKGEIVDIAEATEDIRWENSTNNLFVNKCDE